MGSSENAKIAQFVSEWKNTCSGIEALELPKNIGELVDGAVKAYGEQIAIRAFEDDQALSFDALGEQVFRLAHGLHKIGVRKGSHVAVLMTNRIEYPVAWLAIASLGAVMVPTITRLTSNELDFLFNDADVEYVVLEDAFLPLIENMTMQPPAMVSKNVVVLGESGSYSSYTGLQEQGDPQFRTPEAVSNEDLVNIQYTSGTTGLPKGCMQSQEFWLVIACSLAELDTDIKAPLADHPFFYIDPQWMLLFVLKTGGTLYLAKNLSTSRYLDWVSEHPIDFSYFPKPLLNLPEDPREKQHKLKRFTTASMNQTIIKKGESRLGVPIRQNYGMTEIGACLMVPDDVPDEGILDTCGIPAPFRELRIIDEDGNDVKDGERGELIVKGKGIFRGYYNRPEANEESFIGDWFRTGDLFVKTQEGYYKIVGRIKEMIRRSSENISALEVEQAIMEFEPVAEAAAIAVPDDYRGEEVKVFVRLKDGYKPESATPEMITSHCQPLLAQFKLPRYIHYVSEFSYTPSEKIEKTKLIKLNDGDFRKDTWDSLQNSSSNA